MIQVYPAPRKRSKSASPNDIRQYRVFVNLDMVLDGDWEEGKKVRWEYGEYGNRGRREYGEYRKYGE